MTLRCMDFTRDDRLFNEQIVRIKAKDLPSFLEEYRHQTNAYNRQVQEYNLNARLKSDPRDTQVARSIIYREVKHFNYTLLV